MIIRDMKKILHILASLFLVTIVSCGEKELIMTDDASEQETVTFNMRLTFPEKVVQTRAACSDNPLIDHIYVATFGRRGALNEYVKAIPVGSYATQNGREYEMKVTLLAASSPRHVHVIANGPESLDYNNYDKDLMPYMTTTYESGVPQGAFWQYFYLPDGTARLGEDGNWTETASATSAFQSIELVRNFARISVSVDPSCKKFQLDPNAGFFVFNTEGEGSIAMATSTNGLDNYYDTKTYSTAKTSINPIQYLQTIAAPTRPVGYVGPYVGPYKGYTPSSTALVNTTALPSTDITYNKPGEYQYVYESLKTGDDTKPFIILRGRLTGQTAYSYFRIELTDADGNMYPIFRNVDYTIKIMDVLGDILGAADPKDARTCNGNISTAVTSNIPELSDGGSALFVLFTDRTEANGTEANKKVTFMYRYIPDVDDMETSGTCTLAIIPKEESDTSEDSIVGADGSSWYSQSSTPDEDGWYTVTYYVKPSSSISGEAVTTFRVTGTTNGQKLFRDITTRLIPVQDYIDLDVAKGSFIVEETETTYVTADVTFDIPDGLPKSMFPLDFEIQDSALALDPVGTDMPLKTHSDGVTYHFEKSVSYEEYEDNKTVTCRLRVIRSIPSGGTKISIHNPYFNDPTPLTFTGQ